LIDLSKPGQYLLKIKDGRLNFKWKGIN